MANKYEDPSQWGPWSRENIAAIAQGIDLQAAKSDPFSQGGTWDSYNNQPLIGDDVRQKAQQNLQKMDQAGVQYLFQAYGFDKPQIKSGSFWDDLGDFVTNPAFLVAAGGLGAMYAAPAAAGGAGAGGGAGSGAAAYEGLGGLVTGGGAGGGSLGFGAGAGAAGTGITAGAGGGWTAAEEAAMLTGSGGAGGGGLGGASAVVGGAPSWGANPVAGEPPWIPGGEATLGGGGYQFPWYDVLKGAIGAHLANEQANDMKKAAGVADPFAGQRPHYQQQFEGLTSTPSGFFQDPAIADIIGFQQDSTAKKLASLGYNMSGNLAQEVGKTGMREAFEQYIPFSRMIGEAAGAFQGTQGAGALFQAGAQAQGASNEYYGNILENIFRGQQPTSAEQVQGAQPNKNLFEGVFL